MTTLGQKTDIKMAKMTNTKERKTKQHNDKWLDNKKFNDDLDSMLKSQNCNFDFLEKWYKSLQEQLEVAFKIQAMIGHSRHIGDARESVLFTLLKKILPQNYGITKGYAINTFGNKSRELDCIFYAKDKTFKLASTDTLDYVPIESVLANIEIKSNLNLSEIRKIVLNSISLKQLSHLTNETYKFPHQYLYCVFAYESEYSLDELASRLNKLSQKISEKNRMDVQNLPIHIIYVLGKGLIYRKQEDNKYFKLTVDDVAESTRQYGADKDDRFALLQFIGTIIDFIIEENRKRIVPKFLNYALAFEKLRIQIAGISQGTLQPNSKISFK